MARRKCIGIRSHLKDLISGPLLSKVARESGFMKRRRKIDPVKFFWTLVLGFATGRERQIAGMRRAYQASTGQSLVPSSFYDRFTPPLVKFLKGLRRAFRLNGRAFIRQCRNNVDVRREFSGQL